jgi:phosphoglycerol transferase MdoB-like AlkP superfamily enzyme
VTADDVPVDLPATGTDDPEFSLDRMRRRARRMAWLFLAAAFLLIPWTAYLAVTLPKRDIDTHYRGAWVGFDLLLVATIVLTAYYAFKVDTRVQLPATATATLLLVDAWFDVMTAGGRKATASALLMALCIEIPAALFSLWLARRVNHNADRIALVAHGYRPDVGRVP